MIKKYQITAYFIAAGTRGISPIELKEGEIPLNYHYFLKGGKKINTLDGEILAEGVLWKLTPVIEVEAK